MSKPQWERAATNEQGSKRDRSRPPAPEPLPLPVTDNHCHLDVGDGDAWRAPHEAIHAAADVNVTRIVQVGCNVTSSAWAVETAREHPSVVAAVAIHPNDAARLARDGELDDAIEQIDKLAQTHEDVRAVGETGLDYFRTRDEEGQAAQQESFRRHIELAHTHDKTLMIHDREAHDDVLATVAASGAPPRWVMHCFSGDAQVARACLDMGAYLSFAGTVTFKNAGDLREALAITPLDRILVETDAPFLTPDPFRGRPNASYLIPHTVRAIAEVRGVDLAELCATVQANTTAAYGDWPTFATNP